MLDHQISLKEAHKICTKSEDLRETLAIITNTNNKQTLRKIEVQLEYKGRYQFGRIFNGFLSDPYEITGRKSVSYISRLFKQEPNGINHP